MEMTKKERYLHDAIHDIQITCEIIEGNIDGYYDGFGSLKELVDEIKSSVKNINHNLDKFKGENID